MRIRRGSVTVRYYRAPVGKREYWMVCWYDRDGKRHQSRRNADGPLDTQEAAEAEATKIAEDLVAGKLVQVRYEEAQAGIQLRAMLPGVSVSDLVECWERAHPAAGKTTIAQILPELIRAKELAGVCERYIYNIKNHVARAATLPPSPADWTPALVEAWLSTVVGQRMRRELLGTLGMVCRWMRDRGYLPRDWDVLRTIKRPRDAGRPIGILTPEELATLLNASRPEQQRYLAVAAFSGIRSAEILRLKWSNVAASIEVPALAAKTRARRLVPVLPALCDWLGTPGARSEPVVPAFRSTVDHWCRDWSKLVNWSQNCIRHSYISYRMATTQSAAQVALECGTSERKIFAHYRELVTEAAAMEWFGLTRSGVANLLQARDKESVSA